MDFLATYGLFLAKTATWVLAILIVAAALAAILSKSKQKEQGKLCITKLNEKYEELADEIDQQTQTKEQLKAAKKLKKSKNKQKKKDSTEAKKRLFVLNFNGDLKASAVENLREEITAILLTVKPHEEVLIRLESPGGMVSGYGLAASQLQRLKQANIKLVAAVDKVAASGGYMMACVADKIIAAPFAIVGSIGVVAQLPNFHRFLKKHNVDFEQITAGQYKRTLTLFGENTEKGRTKMQEEMNEIHDLFKTFVIEHRPEVSLEKVATGEYWFAANALDLKLVDHLATSDDYLLNSKDDFELFEIQYKIKKPLTKKISIGIHAFLDKIYSSSTLG